MNRPHFHVVHPPGGSQWSWRYKAANGRIIADGTGFDSEAGVLRSIARFLDNVGARRPSYVCVVDFREVDGQRAAWEKRLLVWPSADGKVTSERVA